MKETFFELIRSNLKNPKFYIFLLALAFVFLLLFPYIDANIFYYNRVEKRISILESFAEIDYNTLKENPILEGEYQSILSEISKQKDGSISNIFITTSTPRTTMWKFITGAAFMWLMAIICFFIKMDNFGEKFMGFIFFFLIGGVLGLIAQWLPIVFHPVCNYIAIPILEIVAFFLVFSDSPSTSE